MWVIVVTIIQITQLRFEITLLVGVKIDLHYNEMECNNWLCKLYPSLLCFKSCQPNQIL